MTQTQMDTYNKTYVVSLRMSVLQELFICLVNLEIK